MLAVLAGCTTIEAPSPPSSVPTQAEGGGGGGGRDDYRYGGPCTVVQGGVLNRGETVPALRPGATPGSVVNYWVSLVDFPDAPGLWWRFDAFGVGWPAELRAVERDLGMGVNGDLSTCVHCLVVRRDCDDQGESCASEALFPSAGQATIAQMAEAVGDAFVMELSQVELMPVSIGPALSIAPAEGDCYYFDRILVSGRAEADWLLCADSYHCELSADAGNRHP